MADAAREKRARAWRARLRKFESGLMMYLGSTGSSSSSFEEPSFEALSSSCGAPPYFASFFDELPFTLAVDGARKLAVMRLLPRSFSF